MTSKIKSPERLNTLLSSLKKQKKKIVFTNGCFDLLHAGHVRYLKEAKKLGDILIVALNSDRSVKSIKGKKRPIVPLSERAEVIAALTPVDYVTYFHEDTPYQLISLLMPHLLVKGGDWQSSQIIGSDIVIENGGEVKCLRFHQGKSTTDLINKIIKNYS